LFFTDFFLHRITDLFLLFSLVATEKKRRLQQQQQQQQQRQPTRSHEETPSMDVVMSEVDVEPTTTTTTTNATETSDSSMFADFELPTQEAVDALIAELELGEDSDDSLAQMFAFGTNANAGGSTSTTTGHGPGSNTQTTQQFSVSRSGKPKRRRRKRDKRTHKRQQAVTQLKKRLGADHQQRHRSRMNRMYRRGEMESAQRLHDGDDGGNDGDDDGDDDAEIRAESHAQQQQEQRRQRTWSFRRFGADRQANTAVDTWDYLLDHSEKLLTGLNDRYRDLMQTEQQVRTWKQAAFPDQPNSHDGSTQEQSRNLSAPNDSIGHAPLNRADSHRIQRNCIDTATHLLQRIREQRRRHQQERLSHQVKHPDCPGSPTFATNDNDDDTAGNTTRPKPCACTCCMHLSLQSVDPQVGDLEHLLVVFIRHSQALLKHANAALTKLHQTRTIVSAQNDKVREFINTVWSMNLEQNRAFPPFFDLGPLDAPLYGIGHVDPSPPSTSQPPLHPVQQQQST
jgi:hypothetical protein